MPRNPRTADVAPQPAISADALRQLMGLCAIAAELGVEVEAADANLKAKKAALRAVLEEDIPQFMTELGVTEIRLESGEKIKIADDVQASITEATEVEAYRWLEEKGFGGLIKTNVSIQFGRDQLEAAKALADRLEAEGLDPEFKRSVHWQTLRAFLKEQLAAAAEIPLDLFNARPVKVAKITGGGAPT